MGSVELQAAVDPLLLDPLLLDPLLLDPLLLDPLLLDPLLLDPLLLDPLLLDPELDDAPPVPDDDVTPLLDAPGTAPVPVVVSEPPPPQAKAMTKAGTSTIAQRSIQGFIPRAYYASPPSRAARQQQRLYGGTCSAGASSTEQLRYRLFGGHGRRSIGARRAANQPRSSRNVISPRRMRSAWMSSSTGTKLNSSPTARACSAARKTACALQSASRWRRSA